MIALTFDESVERICEMLLCDDPWPIYLCAKSDHTAPEKIAEEARRIAQRRNHLWAEIRIRGEDFFDGSRKRDPLTDNLGYAIKWAMKEGSLTAFVRDTESCHRCGATHVVDVSIRYSMLIHVNLTALDAFEGSLPDINLDQWRRRLASEAMRYVGTSARVYLFTLGERTKDLAPYTWEIMR